MVLSVQSRFTPAVTAQPLSSVTSAPATALRFGATNRRPDEGGQDVFFRQEDDYPGVRPAPTVSPIRNVVAQPLAQLQQARSLAELLTVLDRRTGYLSGQQHGICPDRSKDGIMELTYPDKVVTVDLTVPPQLADTHVLDKDRRLAGGNSPWNRPYRYMAVPKAIAGKVPTHRTDTGGIGFSMGDLMGLLNSQPQTPSIISFGNRPSVAVSVEKPDGTMIRFTIDTNVKRDKADDKADKTGDLPPVRVVNFSATRRTVLGSDDPTPEKGNGVLMTNVPGLPHGVRILVQEVDMDPKEQQLAVGNTLNQLYHHVPKVMLQGTKWPVTEDRAIEPGDTKNEHNYVYPNELNSLVFQYRYGMGHYAPEENKP